MKSVLRSCFDPLPRFMSTKSLTGLVLMVLIGTGISVYEYLESSHVPVRAAATASDEVSETDVSRPCESREPMNRNNRFRDADFVEQPSSASSAEQISECTRSAASDAPSMFEPPADHTGS
jgi:hypothetical protein